MQAQIAGKTDLETAPMWRMIHEEQRWIESPRSYGIVPPSKRIFASRWTGTTDHPREIASETDEDYHVVGIAVRGMNLAVFAAQRLIHDGRMPQGTVQINQPAQSMRAIFRSCYDVLHLHIPNILIADMLENSAIDRPVADVFDNPAPFRDPIVEGLGHALIRAEDCGSPMGPTYADSIGVAITARLIARRSTPPPAFAKSAPAPLAKWRLRRVTDYVDAHLADPIGLADLAAATGLSRMHFAAQFRAATGLRPHEYLLRRRIERAQNLLAASRQPLCDVALDVGFKSQAHFTTVFARFVGETPNAWRARHHGLAALADGVQR